ncbi:unnamed protein product [Ceutorhynchus assimilis]|uniref:Nucleoside phosphorylase domain-containing protein n=1 Tax=Ceutorhynchus assimilis TaxID=467358 RepID=A0A9N9MEB2_9CUCU|nr:unnamed protein product [Ceutorhynchus assimilis]
MIKEQEEKRADSSETRDGTVKLRNPHIELFDQDILYHIALGSKSHDLVEMFGDVKFVCMGGTPKRMETSAHYIMEEIGYKIPTGTTLMDISQHSYRYSIYKVGPVISVSHGIGSSSIGVLLHEMIKLMYHAKAEDPIFFRIGTCGGLGLEPGTVVISDDAMNGLGNHYYSLPILGKVLKRPVKLDKKLVRELKALVAQDDPYDTTTGTTMCAEDFYEGQGRIDGAFCDYTEVEKQEYLKSLVTQGVKNIEMESVPFSALTHQAGIKAAIVCVTILNRLKGDQIAVPKEVITQYQQRLQILATRYIKKYLQTKDSSCLLKGSFAVESP